MKDFLIHQLLPALQEPLKALLLLLATLIADRIRRYIRNRELAQMLVTLEEYAARSVADVFQRTVKAAKENGGWDENTKRAAKEAAIDSVRQLAPTLINRLSDAGENIDATLGQMVERAVVKLNAERK